MALQEWTMSRIPHLVQAHSKSTTKARSYHALEKILPEATALSLCPANLFLVTSHFAFPSLTTIWNISLLFIEALKGQFFKLGTLLEHPNAEGKMLLL